MPPGAERARMGMRSIGTTGERSHGPCREGGGPRRGTHRRVETAVGGRSGGSRVAGGREEGVRWNRSPRTGGGLGGTQSPCPARPYTFGPPNHPQEVPSYRAVSYLRSI